MYKTWWELGEPFDTVVDKKRDCEFVNCDERHGRVNDERNCEARKVNPL
jgi:hypothetical protein